jgi:hypothetical protein
MLMNAFQTIPNRSVLNFEMLIDVTRAHKVMSTQGVS